MSKQNYRQTSAMRAKTLNASEDVTFKPGQFFHEHLSQKFADSSDGRAQVLWSVRAEA
jgi:hypothetical protein